jgi:hypothetical protein
MIRYNPNTDGNKYEEECPDCPPDHTESGRPIPRNGLSCGSCNMTGWKPVLVQQKLWIRTLKWLIR